MTRPRAERVDGVKSAAQATPQLAWVDPEALATLFETALDSTCAVDLDVSVARLPVRVRAAGDAVLSRLSRAISHLEQAEPVVPALTIHVWDSVSTGAGAPELPAIPVTDAAPKARYAYDDGRVLAAYQPSGGMLSVLDRQSGQAWFWIRDATRIPFLDQAEPLRLILHWWLGDRSVQLLHGGGVGTTAGGVLVTGRNGSGKSTATLAGLGRSRLRYAGDDYVAVSLDPEPMLFSVYGSGKLERGHATRLPHLFDDGAPTPSEDEKTVVYVEERFGGSVIPEFPLRAVLLPRITDRARARLVRATGGEALAALAPTTLLQLHPPQPNALANMGRLVREVPVYALELGSDIASIPEAILGYLDDGLPA